MDEIRRGAMMKMGKYAAGAVGLAATVGRGNVAIARDVPIFNNPPPSAPYASGGMIDSMQPSAVSPLEQARWKAAAPLQEQIDNLEGYRGYRLSSFMGNDQSHSYLGALRSTAPHWRASVLLERQKQKASAIATLQEQISKMLRSPLDALEEPIREAINGFLAEMQKP